jgi:hypothetical protein
MRVLSLGASAIRVSNVETPLWAGYGLAERTKKPINEQTTFSYLDQRHRRGPR